MCKCRCVKARVSIHRWRTKPLTLPGRNQACFSRSCGACAFHSFLSLSPFFSVSAWFIAQVVFHPICSSVPVYLLCVPTDGFVCLCVCGLSCLDLVIILCFAEEIPDVCENTLFATGLSPEHVCFICAQLAPRRCFSGVAEVQSPAWRSHPLETNQSPGCRVGTSVLLLSCFCLLENRIYLAFLKCAVDEGSLLKAPPQATRNI